MEQVDYGRLWSKLKSEIKVEILFLREEVRESMVSNTMKTVDDLIDASTDKFPPPDHYLRESAVVVNHRNKIKVLKSVLKEMGMFEIESKTL